MTLREALTTAVDYIRSTTDDRGLLQAAKALEKSAERQRARMEKPAMWEYRCHCGERREPRALVCALCYPHVPMRLLIDFLAGNLRARRRAARQIQTICESRALVEQGRDAA